VKRIECWRRRLGCRRQPPDHAAAVRRRQQLTRGRNRGQQQQHALREMPAAIIQLPQLAARCCPGTCAGHEQRGHGG
jgi:hypothetical protein